ncbi:uncharacterized protein FOMMEDRAFT_155847 [Fomitiporia mediterranea MF3/22]|uniref:uncharacterized protein n=1 Tax=Fomitiporia mediterranea (strain MF3/22) TaxID=694068 RepID=UPI0004407FCE|nr:uncharacterized protein FOMMEDRAFT_155847 [Fomitiporia mediterranea MF3/22]EJD02561.1 hypothetical protein FOMMEDRAFT_155847 [Fomitiporia mediterranea MF3/22]
MDIWEKYSLTSTDPCRTTLTDAQSPQQIVYQATTDESGSRPITTFVDASGNVIASLEWHLHLSDKVSVHGREMENVGKWLKGKKLGKGRGFSFTDEQGHTYTWEKAEDSPDIQVFADDDKTIAIAKFIPPALEKTPGGKPTTTFASILISKHAKQISDDVVLSALLIEKANRTSRKDLFASDSGWGVFGLFNALGSIAS